MSVIKCSACRVTNVVPTLSEKIVENCDKNERQKVTSLNAHNFQQKHISKIVRLKKVFNFIGRKKCANKKVCKNVTHVCQACH